MTGCSSRATGAVAGARTGTGGSGTGGCGWIAKSAVALGGLLRAGSGDRSCEMLVRLGTAGGSAGRATGGLECSDGPEVGGGDRGKGGGTEGPSCFRKEAAEAEARVGGWPFPKLPVRLRRLLGGSPSCEDRGPSGITARELTRVSKRGEGSAGLFCSTGEWAGCGSGGGTRLTTGLRDAFRADSKRVECSPLNLRLSSVAACTNASSPPKPPGPPRDA